MKGFNLRGRDLSAFDLRDVDLQETVLRRARIRANLRGALLLRADLRSADLHGAALDDKETDLRGADLRGAKLSEALLDGADVRVVRGLVLNSTRVRNARFSPTAADPWSILRRNYTGPKLGFNLILLLLFLAPYAAKTLAWVAVNRVQETAHNAVAWFEERTPDNSHTSRDNWIDAASDYLSSHAPSPENGWRRYHVWQLLLGVDRDPAYWTTAAILILYNIARVVLTLLVAPLRDEEERSGHSPSYRPDSFVRIPDAYGWMVWLHRVVQTLFIFAVTSFGFNLISWMTLTVLLPPK